MPYKFEAGTPDIAAAIGLGAALDYLQDIGMEDVRAHERELTEYALDMLPREVKTHPHPWPAVGRTTAPGSSRSTSPTRIRTTWPRSSIARRLPCAPATTARMPLHTRLGEEASARASFNVYTDRDDIDRLAEGLNKVERLFGRAPTTASTAASVSH